LLPISEVKKMPSPQASDPICAFVIGQGRGHAGRGLWQSMEESGERAFYRAEVPKQRGDRVERFLRLFHAAEERLGFHTDFLPAQAEKCLSLL